MKKIFTFTNIIAMSAFVTLMLFFTPCIGIYTFEQTSTPHKLINLFQATFGCNVDNPSSSITKPIQIVVCAGLVVAFVFLIIGMGLSVAKNKKKYLGFGASASYITSGILIACAVPMIKFSNYDTVGAGYTIAYYGWTIAIATIILFIGLVAFIDTMASYSKPKVQEVY